MASNPMQKKAMNSFLLGFFVMLIIAVIVGGIAFFIMNRNNKKAEEQNQAGTQTYVYRLNTNVESGKTIESSMVTSVLVNAEAVPNDAVASKTKTTVNGKEEWVDRSFTYAGYKSKIALTSGTIITESMLYEDEAITDSERIVEYNVLQLPVQLDIGEYIDIRFLFSNGQDYIIVSHKEVMDITEDTIWLKLREDEILLMSNAIVEAAISPATNIYVTKYVEPGLQGAATTTYVPSSEVINLINSDPNVVDSAKATLISRYNGSSARGYIQNELNKYSMEATDNIEQKIEEMREQARQAREEYLYGVN